MQTVGATGERWRCRTPGHTNLGVPLGKDGVIDESRLDSSVCVSVIVSKVGRHMCGAVCECVFVCACVCAGACMC